jgi:A/G-specific adenine glycosylase
MNRSNLDVFKDIVWSHYDLHARTMPWRQPDMKGVFNPYKILVSELMLQQTQVERVQPKYNEFVKKFPDLQSLANASFADVMRVWTGLGYNRRAKYLHEFAIIQQHENKFPMTVNELQKYKGIGSNTAAAVLVYSYNKPLIFIETNIRTVYIHHFFKDNKQVTDKELIDLVEQTIDKNNPRIWYWALMDYGSYLKRNGVRNLHRSKQHRIQSKFEGSARQLRGIVLKELLNKELMTLKEIDTIVNDNRLHGILLSLEKDKMIVVSDGLISLQ